jgi:hypothetical protein
MGGNPSAKGTHQMSDFVDSTGDDRVINNVMRHGYRVLTEREKETMQNWQLPKPRSKRR